MGNSPSIYKISYSSLKIGMRSTKASRKSQRAQEQDKGTIHRNPSINKGKNMVLENIHTPSGLVNALSWGDQPILESVDEVVDFQAIYYDRKRQLILKITRKNRRMNL
jgi:hypothetical protein